MASWPYFFYIYRMRILQISDIHFGGDYNGKFPVEKNFRNLIDCAINYPEMREFGIERFDLIAITGDLADCNYEENYGKIKSILDATGIDYLVLPGNHDDAAVMRSVFMHGHSLPECGYVVRNGVLFWDNCDLSLTSAPDGEYRTVFCHYPVGTVQHAFMEKHAHPYRMALAEDLYANHHVSDVFCGHFHWSSGNLGVEKIRVHVAAASQVQLDPNVESCSPVDYMQPGGKLEYVAIEVDDLTGMLKKFETVSVDANFDEVCGAMLSDSKIESMARNVRRLSRAINTAARSTRGVGWDPITVKIITEYTADLEKFVSRLQQQEIDYEARIY